MRATAGLPRVGGGGRGWLLVALVGNGLLLGRWMLIPAGVFLAWALSGMIRQGRRRI